MLALYALIIALAAWRLTHMVYNELGPLGVFARLRAWAASKHGKRVGGISDLFSCFLCLSFWVAILIMLALTNIVGQLIVLALAISAAAILINTVYNKLKQ